MPKAKDAVDHDVRRAAVWLLLLGALTTSGIRAQVSPSNEVTLRVIVVDSADKAQRLVTRLNGGEDFIAIAQAESIDPTASTGGLLGRLALSTPEAGT